MKYSKMKYILITAIVCIILIPDTKQQENRTFIAKKSANSDLYGPSILIANNSIKKYWMASFGKLSLKKIYCIDFWMLNGQTNADSGNWNYDEQDSVYGYSIRNDNYIFELMDGTGVKPEDVNDINDIIEMLPLIKLINGNAFLDWLEIHNSDSRKEILEIVRGLPINDREDDFDKLYQFLEVEKQLNELNNVTVRLKSGEFITALSMMSPEEASQYVVSKKVVRNSIRAYAINFINSFNDTGIDIVKKEFDFNSPSIGPILEFASVIKDLIDGLITSDFESFYFSLGSLFTDVLGYKYDKLGDLVKVFDKGSSNLFKNIGKITGVIGSLLGVGSGINGIVSDIKDLVNGNLDGIDKAIKIVSLIENVIDTILTIASKLAAMTGMGYLSIALSIAGKFISAILTIVKWIIGLFRPDPYWQQVDLLESKVRMTAEERRRTYASFKNGGEIPKDIQDLAAKTAVNVKLVEIGLEFLNNKTDFARYVFPASDAVSGSEDVNLFPNNKVFLDTAKDLVRVTRWFPEQSAKPVCCPLEFVNQLDCVAEDHAEVNPLPRMIYAHRCIDAIGVFEPERRTGQMTLLSLGEGNDEAYGRTDTPNIFLIDSGEKCFYGGNANDTFILQSPLTTGILDGQLGNNTLIISEANVTNAQIDINLQSKTLDFKSGGLITLKNIHVVGARKGRADSITAACNTVAIIGGGGTPSQFDIVNIPNFGCNYNLVIEGDHYTIVNNFGAGRFVYFIPKDSEMVVNIDHLQNSNHIVNFDFEVNEIKDAFVQISEGKRFLYMETQRSKTILTMSNLEPENSYYHQPVFILKANVTLRVDKEDVVNLIYNVTREYRDILEAEHFGQSIFFISAGNKIVKGWRGNDTFIIQSGVLGGDVDGVDGTDHLMFEETFHKGDTLFVDVPNNAASAGGTNIILKNFEQFSGRAGSSDHFICSCNTIVVNGQGGRSVGDKDLIVIPEDKYCEYNIVVHMGVNLSVENNAKKGNFTYLITMENNVDFHLDLTSENAKHLFLFRFAAKEITNGTLSADNTTISISGLNGAKVVMPVSKGGEDEVSDSTFFPLPLFISNESAVLRVTYEGQFLFFFNLTTENDIVEGSPFFQNLFYVRNISNEVIGGDNTDVFFLIEESFHGILNGVGGKDRMFIDDSYFRNRNVDIRLDYNSDSYSKAVVADRIAVFNIEEVIGRNKSSETITAGCGTTFVDGKEGLSETNPDCIIFPSNECEYSSTVIVRNSTKVINNAENGAFVYSIQETFGYFDFVSGTDERLNHTVLFALTQQNITNITFNIDTRVINFESKWNTTLSFQIAVNTKNESFYPQPKLIGGDTLQYQIDKNGNIFAIFNIAEGNNETVEGYSFLRNIYVLSNGTKVVKGGDLEDIILPINGSIQGVAHGGKGVNSLVVELAKEHMVEIHPSSWYGKIGTRDLKRPSNLIVYTNFTTIIGRNFSQDNITIDNYVAFVDGKGGFSPEKPDFILIPNIAKANYTLRTNIFIENYTEVQNAAKNGYFHYSIPYPDRELDVNCINCHNATHVFAVAYSILDIDAISWNETKNCSITFTTKLDKKKRSYSMKNSDPCLFPQILTKDFLEIYISQLGTKASFLLSTGNETIEELSLKWIPIATHLNMTVTVLINDTGDYLAISRNHFDILWSSPGHLSYLFGNRHENIYVIAKGEKKVIPEVHIHSFPNSSDVIDLTNLVKPIREKRKSEFPPKDVYYVPEIIRKDSDMRIEILESAETFPTIIIMKDFFSWYENAQITVAETSLQVKQVDGIWKLVPMPILLNQTFVIVDEESFEENTDIVVDRKLPRENSVLTFGDSLLLTNVFDNNTNPTEFFTYVFEDFFETRNPLSKHYRSSYLPQNVKLVFHNSEQVNLQRIDKAEIKDVLDVMLHEKEKLEGSVFGFACKLPGKFPDPKKCNVFHECILAGENEFIQYKFTCPSGLNYCQDTESCGYESRCPCN